MLPVGSLSRHVSDASQGAAIALLLLPFLGTKLAQQHDAEQNILTSVENLLQRADRPDAFVMSVH